MAEPITTMENFPRDLAAFSGNPSDSVCRRHVCHKLISDGGHMVSSEIIGL
jgi:hypothetical protein